MAIDPGKIQRYYMFVHYGASSIGESELQSLAYFLGDENQPDPNDGGWRTRPAKNVSDDPDFSHMHFDYNVHEWDDYHGILYYTHEPGAGTMIHSESWVWVKFTVGMNTYITGELIGDMEPMVDYPREDTQYIATYLEIYEPTPERKYRIWTLKSSNNANIIDENIWVGNTPGDEYSKQTSGYTYGPDYAYVEFTWDELTATTTSGDYISFEPTGVQYLVGESQTFILTVKSSASWSIDFAHSEGDIEWCLFSQTSGTSGTTQVFVSIDENQGVENRTGIIRGRTLTTSANTAFLRIVQGPRRDSGVSS